MFKQTPRFCYPVAIITCDICSEVLAFTVKLNHEQAKTIIVTFIVVIIIQTTIIIILILDLAFVSIR